MITRNIIRREFAIRDYGGFDINGEKVMFKYRGSSVSLNKLSEVSGLSLNIRY